MTDATLVHLQQLAQLQWLNLSDTRVTDVGLDRLKGLAKLGTLDLTHTGVTERGVRKFEQTLPYCSVLLL